MTALISYFQAHPYMLGLIAWWILSAAIGSLPAPTSTSSNFYIWFFKFSNTVAANISRARNTVVESSPNWTAALKKANGGNGK